MKTNVIIIALISLTLSLNSQTLDLSGIPVSNQAENTHQLETVSLQRSMTVSESPEIINAFASPVFYSTGLAYDGELLWLSGYAEYNLYGLDPETGEIVESIPIDFIRPYGLTYFDGRFYVVNNDLKQIVEIDRYTGDVVNINQLVAGNTYPTGVEVVNGQIWYNDARGPYASSSTEDLTVKYDCNIDSCDTYNIVADYPSALASDGSALWVIDNNSQLIHKVNKESFESEKTIHAPGGQYPNGLAFDGEFMWVSNNDSDTIYKMRLEDNNITNIADKENDNIIKVYPTISNNTFNINLGDIQPEMVKIELVSLDGRIIGSKSNINQQILSWPIDNSLVEGLYFFRIDYQNKIITKKVIIRR